MMQMRLISFACAMAAAMITTTAFAAPPACDLATRATSVQQAYDPFASANVVLDVTISVTNNGADACQARFFLNPLNGLLSLANGPDRLIYRIDGPSGGGQTANSFGPYIVQPAGGTTEDFVVRVIVPAQQIVPRGDYVSDLAVTALGDGNAPLLTLNAPLALRVRVPGRVEMSVSGSSAGTFSSGVSAGAGIAFGEAATGKTDRVFVHVWSNGGISVSLDSLNRGKLKLLDSATPSFIDYAARFDGETASLTSRFTALRSPPQNLTGGSYELAITLGNVDGKFAGTYKDVITIAVDQN